MKKFLLSKLLGLAMLAAVGSAHAVIIFTATLTHDQEVINPPIPNEGSSGFATFVLSDDMKTLTYDIQLFGLDLGRVNPATGISNLPVPPGNPNDDATRVHIHSAAFGVNGGIVFGMIETGAIATLNDLDDLVVDVPGLHITGAWDNLEGNGTTLAAQLGNLFASGLYLNVHTADHGGGEIRGQIVPEPATLGLVALGLLAAFGLRRRKIAV